MQPFDHALWERQRRAGRYDGEEGAEAVRFSCMYVLGGARAHICVTYDPYDPRGPPGLEPAAPAGGEFDMGRARPPGAAAAAGAPPPVDTVVGPFAREADARTFALEWAKGLRSVADRRQFGMDLARQVGLRVWHTPPAAPGLRASRGEYLFPHEHRERRRQEGGGGGANSTALSPSLRRQRLMAFRAPVRAPRGGGAAGTAAMELGA